MWPPLPIRLKMLVAIAILPLLLFYATQTSANDEAKYGLGGYTMNDKQQVIVPDDAFLLKTTDDVKNYKTNDHADKQFKPCKVELDKVQDEQGKVSIEFEVFYDQDAEKEGCTVDLVMDKIDEATKTIKTRIKVADTKMGCLDDCEEKEKEWAAMGKNLVPFTYSLSNEDFKKLHKGPPYNEDQKSCKSECTDKGGKCMGSATSLQIAWTKCAKEKVKARAWIQLVGEPVSAWSAKSKENPDEAVIQLSIEMGDNPKHKGNNIPLFTVTGPDGIAENFLYKQSGGDYIYPACFLDEALPMIPEAKMWKINSDNTQINGKHMLVFHLLPQTATRIYNAGGILQSNQKPAPGLPTCVGKLSISISNAVGILQSVPQPTTAPVGTTASETTTSEMPTNETETTAAPKEDNTLLIVGIVALIVLVLIVVAVLAWCFCCRNKDPEEDDDDDEEEEKAENDKSNPYALSQVAVLKG